MAGLVMFLAPCTLPLVPGFVSFIFMEKKKELLKTLFFFVLGLF
ncbi:MAG: cytochrome c biogenesis protein CcdA [Candidatus Paceibacterota bacterium]